MHTLLWIKHPGHCRWRTRASFHYVATPSDTMPPESFFFSLQSLHLLSGLTQIRNGFSGETVSLPEQTASHPEKPTTWFPPKNPCRKSGGRILQSATGKISPLTHPRIRLKQHTPGPRCFPNFENTFLDASVGISVLICGAAGVLWKIQKWRGLDLMKNSTQFNSLNSFHDTDLYNHKCSFFCFFLKMLKKINK